tara:strand:+ start:8494 stop:10419 length:1926 start_codon:yes stop_codon:yes gene_type:complete
MKLHNKRIFISGAAGVIGQQLVKLLEKEGSLIFAADIKDRPTNFSNKIFYRQGDLNEIKRHEIESYECEIFIHLAATFERTKERFLFYDENFKHNVSLNNKLLKLFCNTKKIKKVIFASSYLVYDKLLYLKKNSSDSIVLKEDSLKDTRNLVGTAKYYHEKEVEFYKKFKNNIKFHNLRIFRGYGPGSRDIISRWVRSALERVKIKVFNEDSCFDFIFSLDTASGILQILKKDPKNFIINLGSGKSVKIKDVVLSLKSNFKNLRISRLKSDQLIEKSVSKNDIMKQIGWSPKYNIKTGIKKIIEYEKRIFKQNKKKSKNRILITCFGIKKITWLNHILEAKNRVNKNLDIILGNTKKDTLLKNVYSQILIMPSIQEYTFIKILKILKNNNIKIVLPTSNDELLFWSKNKNNFLQKGITVIISPFSSIKICNDKFKFYKFCKQNNIETIKTIKNFKEIKKLKTKRYVIKERNGSGSKNILKNINYEKVESSLNKFKDFIIQENINSKDEYSVDAWYSGDLKLNKYIVRKRNYIEDGESKITSAVKNFRYSKKLEFYLSRFKLYGPVNFQFFLLEKKIILIECNARIGGATTFSITSGLDLIYYSFLNSFYRDNEYDKIFKKKIFPKNKQFRIISDINENFNF